MRAIFGNFEKKRIEKFLNKKYSQFLKNEYFTISGEYEGDSIRTSLSLTKADKTYEYLIEIFFSIKDNPYLTKEEWKGLSLDFLGWYLEEFFNKKRGNLLYDDWQEIKFNKCKILVRGRISNPLLEKAADKIIERGIPLTDEEKNNFKP